MWIISIRLGFHTSIFPSPRLIHARQRAMWRSTIMGGYRAGEHLAKLGCKRMLHLAGPKDSRDAIERRKGFIQACRDNGIDEDDILIFQGDFHEPSGERCAEYLVQQNELPHGISPPMT